MPSAPPRDASTVCGVDPFAAPLRVLHVAQPATGGVARYAARMAEAQARLGWTVALAAPLGPELDLVERFVWRARRRPASGLRQEAGELGRIVDAVDPDVVTLHSSKAGLVGRLVVRGSRPTVFVPHAWSFLALRGPARQAARAWEVSAGRWSNATVAVSDAEAASGIAAGIRSPMFVVPNPELRGLGPTPGHERPAWRARLGWPDRPTVLCVGRLCRQKGQDLLVQSWTSVRRSCPTAMLVLLGDGPRPAAARHAGPGMIVAGHHPDPRPFLAAADVVAVPSRWEGCSLAMLEAMAVGRSVVTTAVAGSEIVAAAAAGAVVPQDDGEAMARALVERLADAKAADDEGLRGAVHVRTHHRFDTAAERLAAVTARAHAFGRVQPRTSSTTRRTAAYAASGR
jgi:glycosyltransferase involved in cell wall biosynthesis